MTELILNTSGEKIGIIFKDSKNVQFEKKAKEKYEPPFSYA